MSIPTLSALVSNWNAFMFQNPTAVFHFTNRLLIVSLIQFDPVFRNVSRFILAKC